MKDKKIYSLHANICKALGHPTRIEIIDILKNKEMSFGELLKIIGGAKSNLSQHLSSMTSKGILIQRKEGLNNYYKLSSKKVSTACHIMREVLMANLKNQHEILKKM
ncbi:MAG: winged helix-turn-helix transcriptional regulator [Bacteroidetes bacterium]|nr:winged helix-turn-helix transcriptional regulator [Bacteroidota bacterium]